MDDEQNPVAANDVGSDTPYSARGEDYLLQEIVELANLGLGFGMTLTVPGAVISGNVVGGEVYFQELSEIMGDGAHGELGEVLKSKFRRFKELYAESTDDRPPPAYIHLKDARIFGSDGQSIPTTGGVLWRCRINEVSAFSFGTIGRA